MPLCSPKRHPRHLWTRLTVIALIRSNSHERHGKVHQESNFWDKIIEYSYKVSPGLRISA
jgi:hypothetical protein